MIEHDGEHPSVVMADITRRPAIRAKVITFANEKGGVGKSTLAFHTAIHLARAGQKVLTIDLDRRQRSLDRALCNRAATARSLGVDLPMPRHIVLEHQSGAMLAQEISRAGSDCDIVVIDAPGHDSPIARRAIALAETLVTPVNPTFIDIDSVAHFSAASLAFVKPGSFAQTVSALRDARTEHGLPATDWLLVRNRVRQCEKRQLARFDRAIGQLPAKLGLRVLPGLTERVGYRELFLFGLTHADCRSLPGMAGVKVSDCPEIAELLGEMGLDAATLASSPELRQTRTPARSMHTHRQALRRHIGATKRVKTPA